MREYTAPRGEDQSLLLAIDNTPLGLAIPLVTHFLLAPEEHSTEELFFPEARTATLRMSLLFLPTGGSAVPCWDTFHASEAWTISYFTTEKCTDRENDCREVKRRNCQARENKWHHYFTWHFQVTVAAYLDVSWETVWANLNLSLLQSQSNKAKGLAQLLLPVVPCSALVTG